jgi:hypothetical protein
MTDNKRAADDAHSIAVELWKAADSVGFEQFQEAVRLALSGCADGGKDAALTLGKVLFALTERQKGNVIRSENEYIDEARAILAAKEKTS